jgi:hypothetical protein
MKEKVPTGKNFLFGQKGKFCPVVAPHILLPIAPHILLPIAPHKARGTVII